jgi:DNA-binding beta-propeller fold protein YncE
VGREKKRSHIWAMVILVAVLVMTSLAFGQAKPEANVPYAKLWGTYQEGVHPPMLMSAGKDSADKQSLNGLGGGSGMTGVIALLEGAIQIVNGTTLTATPAIMRGQLGDPSGGYLDVSITPNASLALISNFGDSRVYFLSLLNPQAPVVLGSVSVDMFAEDIAITGDGKWALVTDGGLSSSVAVIDVTRRRLVQVLDLGSGDAQAVAVTPDGQTVLCADYLNARVHVLKMSPTTGGLTYMKGINLMPYWPINIAISTDGRTALVASAYGYENDIPPPPASKIGIWPPSGANAAILRIDGPGQVYHTGYVQMPLEVTNGHAVAFSRKGTRAFYSTERFLGYEWDDDYGDYVPVYNNEIHVLSVTGPGHVVPTGTSVRLPLFTGAGSYFGVDSLAVDPVDGYLYVSNHTSFGVDPTVAIISLSTYRLVRMLDAGSFWDPDYMETRPYSPAGVAFRENGRPLNSPYLIMK